MENSLLCINQARANCVVIDDIPPHLDYYGTSKFSVYFPEQDVYLPLNSNGPTSHLHVRYPTTDEMNECPRLELTGRSWEPYENKFGIESSITKTLTFSPWEKNISDMTYRMVQSVITYDISSVSKIDKSNITDATLAYSWGISLDCAKKTLTSTTHESLRVSDGFFHSRYRTGVHQRRYNQLGGHGGRFSSDTCFSKVKSLKGNTCAQVFVNSHNFVCYYPMKTKGECSHALDLFLHDVGIPSELHTDGAKELIQGEWSKKCRKFSIPTTQIEPYTPWQNPAEISIKFLKSGMRRLMQRTNNPIRLWDYCMVYVAELRSLTVSNLFSLNDGTPFEHVKHFTPDISEYLLFSWFDWVWFHQPTSSQKQQLGRFCGVAHDIGQGLCFYLLTEKGDIIVRSTVVPLSGDDNESRDISHCKDIFTKNIDSTIGNYMNSVVKGEDINESDPYSDIIIDDDDGNIEHQEDFKPDIDDINNDLPYVENDDKYIGQHLALPKGDKMMSAEVVCHKRNFDGTLVGTENKNPILDSRVYEVKFSDGSMADYATNVLIENLYSQVDDDGYHNNILCSIIGHRKNADALSQEDGWITLPSGSQKRRITTKGWDLEVEWDNGTTGWIPLSEIKDSNPIEVSEYAHTHDLISEPAFSWWVPHTLKKRKNIVAKAKSRLRNKNMKFGFQIPTSIPNAISIDEVNGNKLWQ